jgi:hypothetical protein
MQHFIVRTVLLSWMIFSALLARIYIADGSCAWLCFVWPLIFSLPFQLRILGIIERQFRPSLTLISNHRRRAWIHLSPLQPTVGLTAEPVRAFWRSVNTSTCQALNDHRTVIISSHLLTGHRLRRLLANLTENGYSVRYRVFRVPFTPTARAVMQLEILFRQWHWYSSFRKEWPVMVIRSKSSITEK